MSWRGREVALFAGLVACGGPVEPTTATAPPRGEQWRAARQELRALRRTYAPSDGTMRVTVELEAGSGSWTMRGRGAVARRLPGDLRMILLGPAGMTALDLLVRGDRFRMEVPARDSVWQGENGDAEREGLPVAFLRWWLLEPLSGRLLSVHQTDDGPVYVLREGDATIRVQRRHDGLVMNRISPSGRERMWVSGPGCARAVYDHAKVGVRASVRCEAEVGGVKDAMFRTPRRTPDP